MEPFRRAARDTQAFAGKAVWGAGDLLRRRFLAGLELISRFELTHTRPAFAIPAVRVGNRDVPVTEEIALDLPFGKLVHFAKDIDSAQPRIMVDRPALGPFLHAPARHRGDAAARPRRLHHRLVERPRRAGRCRQLRRRGLHHLSDPVPGADRPRRPYSRRLPTLCAGARRGGRHVGRQAPGHAPLDDADGRPDRHQREPDRGQCARDRTSRSPGSSSR